MASHADDLTLAAEASTAQVPSLPPSVEDAYRRKCIQLKQRTLEVDEANDASRIRLSRLSRQAEKMRIERAFLLEQLAKRTSTNVEDSDGSPSPPPTPKDKPLRTKRGHRKLSAVPGADPSAATPGSSFVKDGAAADPAAAAPGSPASDAAALNGTRPPKKPSSAFELYCADARPALEKDADDADKAANIDEELARAWKDLPDPEREAYQAKHDEAVAKYRKHKEEPEKKAAKSPPVVKVEKPADAAEDAAEDAAASKENSPAPPAKAAASASQDEDVEMTNYDTEPEAAAAAAAAASAKD